MDLGPPGKTSEKLSSREWEVLRLLMRGYSNQHIATELQIVVKTVEKHLTCIYEKTRVSSRAEAILWGIQKGRDFPT